MGVALTILEQSSRRAPPRPAGAGSAGPLVDAHGRTIRDLRLSITDRCGFRCTYCMEPDVRFLPRDQLLRDEELVRVARVCVGLGVTKVRLTGGEPTLRSGLTRIVEGVSRAGAADVAMTTNGWIADVEMMREWRRAGLTRLTVSLDTLRPERFARLTRSATEVGTVLRAVAAAIDAGLAPVRINAVVIRGQNDDEVADLAGLARGLGVEVRFIEFMPLDSARAWDRSRVVTADEILDSIGRVHPLVPLGRAGRSATALDYAFADGAPGRIGVIAPVSRPFCGACSRLRVTADGKVRPCLFSREEFDIRGPMRAGIDDAALASLLRDCVHAKQAGHGIGGASFVQPERPMSAIGG